MVAWHLLTQTRRVVPTCTPGLCLCVPEAAAWLTEQVVSIIDTQGIDYIVTDGEDMLKRCPGVCDDDNYAAAEYGCVVVFLVVVVLVLVVLVVVMVVMAVVAVGVVVVVAVVVVAVAVTGVL